ncbi:MAG: site-2 protease family protein, partial [Chloroflexota bacterium]
RLSLNPMAHLDPFGTLLLVLAGFGYGKPVPFNEARLRAAIGVTFVALAGPAANIALAALCAIPLRFGSAAVLGGAYETILGAIVLWNCVLAIFNLLPIPPLDGANVLYGLLTPRQQHSWRTYQQYGPFLLLFILLLAPQVLSALVFGPALAIARFLVG